jgi:hypothetical protein
VVRDVVRRHFDEHEAPRVIQLYFVRKEMLAA